MLLIGLVSRHARRLHQALQQKTWSAQVQTERDESTRKLLELEREELPAWFSEAYRAVYGRPDGRRLCLGLLDQLGGERLAGVDAYAGPDRWSPVEGAWGALLDVLSESDVSQSHIQAFWQEREHMRASEEAARAPRHPRVESLGNKVPEAIGRGSRTLHYKAFNICYGAACLLGRRTLQGDEAGAFWQWLRELFEGRAPGTWSFLGRGHIDETCKQVGRILALLPEPDAAWREAYDRLEPQRRRDQFLLRYADDDAHEPSVALLLIGLFGCAAWFEGAGRASPTAAHAWFWRLFDAARRLWLTEVLEVSGLRQIIVPICFSFIPELFKNSTGEALRRAVPAIAEDPLLLSLAAFHLWKNGVEPIRLEKLFADAGTHIVAALRDAHQWSQLTGLAEEFPPGCKTLADALAIDFA